MLALVSALATSLRLVSLTSHCLPEPSVLGADLGGAEHAAKAAEGLVLALTAEGGRGRTVLPFLLTDNYSAW